MNVTVEHLAPCKKLIRFEEEAGKVDQVFSEIEKNFQRHASLPGFRPGKAPKEMVNKQYQKDIEDEAKRRLFNTCFQEGVKQEKLVVVSQPEIEEIQFGRGQNLLFAATVETAPIFELPEYRGLPAKREIGSVTDQDIERALEALRSQKSTFEKLERPIQKGDIAVINYAGTTDGKPIVEVAPAAQSLSEKKNFWVEIIPDAFIPGFTEQIMGARANDKRTVTVEFPANFPTTELAGKKANYEVEVVEVKQRISPELNDALAKAYGADSVDALRNGVRADLQNEKNLQQRNNVRSHVIRVLLDRVQFDLPESTVQNETRNLVYDIVSRNQKRGVPKDVIEKEKEEIYATANQTAKERVKAMYIFDGIAAKEGIRVASQELNARILELAQSYKMSPDKFIKQLEENRGVGEIEMQILHDKVISFLAENAKIEDVAPAS